VSITPATTHVYTFSLHDALPISWRRLFSGYQVQATGTFLQGQGGNSFEPFSINRVSAPVAVSELEFLKYHLKSDDRYFAEQELQDRKSTRLNSSHVSISYAVFCF